MRTDAKICGMGHSMKRKEDPRFIRGKGNYVDDIKLPGMLYGRMIGASVPAAEILEVDTSKAEALPGVKAVWVTDSRIVRFAGQDVAAVAATSPDIARDAALGPLSGATGARFDPTRLSWIGTPTKETNVCVAYHTSQVKSVLDLYDKQLIVGDTGPGTGTRSYPKALNELLGMKFKLVGGFPASSDVFLAMERGEVEGICESLDSIKIRRPDWIPTKKISILFQGGVEPSPELDGVPFVLDLARTGDQRQAIEFLYAGQGIGRPFVAPPDLPADRLKMLRDAFKATMTDPAFVAETQKSKLDLEPEDGEHLAALIAKIYATPKPIVDKVTSLIK